MSKIMFTSRLLIFSLVLLLLGGTLALGQEKKAELSKEQQAAYEVLIKNYVKKIKGWEPEDYDIRLVAAFAIPPLVIFDVMRYDARAENINEGRLGSHPTGEVQVYIQTEEMRAFSDYNEFHKK